MTGGPEWINAIRARLSSASGIRSSVRASSGGPAEHVHARHWVARWQRPARHRNFSLFFRPDAVLGRAGHFLTSLSHELSTPINAAIGYADLLQPGIGGELKEQQREYISRIAQTQVHLRSIIISLLDHGRVEAGEPRHDIAPTPLRGIIERVSAMIEPQALARGITLLVSECPPGVLVLSDRTRAEPALLDLLANAITFTPPAGRVTVTCGTRDALAVVTVQDTGPEVPLESHDANFAPFVPLGRTLTSGHEGTGPGRAIGRRLARAMGGDVDISSEPGEGASFRLSLPLANEE